MRITIAQLNPTVGDIKGNIKKARQAITISKTKNPDLIVFPELYLTGYPPRDLLDSKWFLEQVNQAEKKLIQISRKNPGMGILIGTVLPANNKKGKKLHNAAILFYKGKIISKTYKTLLPSYDVFDETRYFQHGKEIKPVKFKGNKIGITICEDAWNIHTPLLKERYHIDPVKLLAAKGIDLLINISASPFHIGKESLRRKLFTNHAKKYKIPVVFVNQIGGNDELVFDGRSMFFDKRGNLNTILPSFEEKIKTVDTASNESINYTPQKKIESLYNALVLGLKDYTHKCGFKKVILGLSGGIDSAVTCCIAKDALGKENVIGITMPSRYSSMGSIEDSKKLSKTLGIKFETIPIKNLFSTYLRSLKKQFAGRKSNIAEENIQARIRGNILMALSNKFGYMVLSTGNKSEAAVGYCTLYGDMSGGLSVLSDVPKTLVYKLADYINKDKIIIPEKTITKVPSAELRPNQKDQDTLPPYEILDKIIELYIDRHLSIKEISSKRIPLKTVKWVVNAINKSEYKRRQSAPGLKVTSKAFGTGRRMPIAAKYSV
ncbi:MAG: NAD+ synthase [Candidatus Aureabacteria bacterium]|nr:NAD+ synthase [Candidatus Auribacterota bacterium]